MQILFMVLLNAMVATASTISNHSSYYPVSWFARPLGPQFQHWYPKFSKSLHGHSVGVCNVTYNDYLTSYNAPLGSYDASLLLRICYGHENCLLDSIASNIIVNFQSATVILGLMPTLLSTIGPSVAEISLVSAHRPILAFLIIMGAPAIWPTRIFGYNDPTDLFVGPASRQKLQMRSIIFWPALLISVLQYLLAATAVINIVHTSILLGERSILTWGCTTNFMPLVWTSAACIVHIIAAASYILARMSKNGLSKRNSIAASSTYMKASRRFSAIYHGLKAESTICANHVKPGKTEGADMPLCAVFLNVCAGCVGFAHLVLGTLIFSSLQFIGVWDIFNSILWRYLVSTAVCRMILIVELAGLRSSK